MAKARKARNGFAPHENATAAPRGGGGDGLCVKGRGSAQGQGGLRLLAGGLPIGGILLGLDLW